MTPDAVRGIAIRLRLFTKLGKWLHRSLNAHTIDVIE
jgi:hypothetical protein